MRKAIPILFSVALLAGLAPAAGAAIHVVNQVNFTFPLTASLEDVGPEVVAVVIVGTAILIAELDALKIRLEDEVGDTADRVRTVYGRSAAGGHGSKRNKFNANHGIHGDGSGCND